MVEKARHTLVLLAAAIAFPLPAAPAAEPLPPRALARIGGHHLYHGPGISCAVLSPDGRRIASSADYWNMDSKYVPEGELEEYNGTIILWDALTGERLRELRGLTRVTRLCFSPDSKSLAAAHADQDGKFIVTVFSPDTGRPLRRIGLFRCEVSSLQFSPDGGRLLVGEARGAVSSWDAASGKRLCLWEPSPEGPAPGAEQKWRGLGGALGGLNVASGRAGGAGERWRGLSGVPSPDGKVIAWRVGCPEPAKGADGWRVAGLRVQDAATDKLLYRKRLEAGQELRSLAFSADGRRLAAHCGDKLFVWDAATGAEQGVIEETWADGFALSPDGRRVAFYPNPAGYDQLGEQGGIYLNLWDVDAGKRVRQIPLGFLDTLQRTPEPGAPAFSADGKTLLLADPPTVRLFDPATGSERFPAVHFTPVLPCFSADGRALLTSCFARRCRWDVSAAPPALVAREWRKPRDHGLAYGDGDRLLLGSFEAPAPLCERATGRVLCRLKGSVPTCFGLIAPDSSRALLGTRTFVAVEEVRLYDLKTGGATGEIAPGRSLGLPTFSPDGRLVAWAGGGGAVCLYDAVTGEEVRTLRPREPLPEQDPWDAQLLFTPDGERLIVTTYDTSVESRTPQPTRVFQVGSGREVVHFHANPEKKETAAPLSCLACSPDGRLLAVAEEYSGAVRLLEVASGAVRAEFAGHRHGVQGLAFSPDGKMLASGGKDLYAFLWDVTGARTVGASRAAGAVSLAARWGDLASADGRRAGAAIAELLQEPETAVALIRERLVPAEVPGEGRLARLVADLDADDFKTREAASRELTLLGKLAEAALRAALRDRPSLEARRRMEDVLAAIDASPPAPETLRVLRAIEVLEHAGTPAARRHLEALARGGAGAPRTIEAQRALRRLTRGRGRG